MATRVFTFWMVYYVCYLLDGLNFSNVPGVVKQIFTCHFLWGPNGHTCCSNGYENCCWAMCVHINPDFLCSIIGNHGQWTTAFDGAVLVLHGRGFPWVSSFIPWYCRIVVGSQICWDAKPSTAKSSVGEHHRCNEWLKVRTLEVGCVLPWLAGLVLPASAPGFPAKVSPSLAPDPLSLHGITGGITWWRSILVAGVYDTVLGHMWNLSHLEYFIEEKQCHLLVFSILLDSSPTVPELCIRPCWPALYCN